MMTPEQKEILITNRSKLVECLNVRDGLFTELIANKVMTQRNYRTISQSGKTPDQQAEELLDFLAKKGAADFEKFCDALIADNQETIVTEILRKSQQSDCRSHDPGCNKPVPVESENCNDTRFKRPHVDVTDYIHANDMKYYPALDNRNNGRSYAIDEKRAHGRILGIEDKMGYGNREKYPFMTPDENSSGHLTLPERKVEENEVYNTFAKLHDLIRNGGESFQKEELRYNLKHFINDPNYHGFNVKAPFYDIDKVKMFPRLEEEELREKRERLQHLQNSSMSQQRICYKDNEKQFSGYNPSRLIPSDEEQFPFIFPPRSSLYEVHHVPSSPRVVDYQFLHRKSVSGLPSSRLSRADSIDAMTKRPCDQSSPEIDGSGKRSRTDDVESAPLHIDREQEFVRFHDRESNRIITIPLKSQLPYPTQLDPNFIAARPLNLELSHPTQETHGPTPSKSITDDPDLVLTDGPVNVLVEKCTRQFYFAHRNQSYGMTHIPRGKALIINVNEVIGKPPRRGTNIDRDNLQNLFHQLHFETIVYNDKDELTARDIALKLRMFADIPDHKNADACVVCLLSHGEEGCIFGTDGKKINLDAVFSCFDNQSCEYLRGKPKLFIIQACRGGALDKGVKYSPDEHDGSDLVKSVQVPSQSDMVICFPTQYGYYAWRNRDRGSWYVEALVQVFMKYAKCEDICTMLNRVNLLVSRKVSHCRQNEMDQMCQMSEYKSTLRMPHFYFFPGIGHPNKAV